MNASSRRKFPVTSSRLPVVRCQVCRRTFAHRPGAAGEVLTAHYLREHPEVGGASVTQPV